MTALTNATSEAALRHQRDVAEAKCAGLAVSLIRSEDARAEAQLLLHRESIRAAALEAQVADLERRLAATDHQAVLRDVRGIFRNVCHELRYGEYEDFRHAQRDLEHRLKDLVKEHGPIVEEPE